MALFLAGDASVEALDLGRPRVWYVSRGGPATACSSVMAGSCPEVLRGNLVVLGVLSLGGGGREAELEPGGVTLLLGAGRGVVLEVGRAGVVVEVGREDVAEALPGDPPRDAPRDGCALALLSCLILSRNAFLVLLA